MPRPPRDRPWISANFATTWDARISTRKRTPSDFSSREDKRRFLEIRALADAVLVSAVTASRDGMTIGLPSRRLREERAARGQHPYPLRVLITNSGRIDPGLAPFAKRFSRIAIFSTKRMPRRIQAELASKADLHLAEGERVDLRAMLRTLRRDYDVRHLHCEGGGSLFKSLADEDLVDELYLTLCPMVFGGAEAPTLTGKAGDFLPQSRPLRLMQMEVVGGECFLRYRVKRSCPTPPAPPSR